MEPIDVDICPFVSSEQYACLTRSMAKKFSHNVAMIIYDDGKIDRSPKTAFFRKTCIRGRYRSCEIYKLNADKLAEE
ncbi:MAG: hypothetical protein ABIA21_01720 [Candidatus Aenigmatarchaeota archaeon]